MTPTRWPAAPAALVLVLAAAPATLAQSRPLAEVHGSLGAARVSRAEDRSFGTGISPGGGLEVRVLDQLGIGVDMSHTTGFAIPVAVCAPPPGVTCAGSAGEGIRSVTLFSTTAAWYVGRPARVQPYVVGGYGLVRSRGVSSLTMAGPSVWTVTESSTRDTGGGVTAGVGLRIAVRDHVVIRPEFRISDGSVVGRENLTVMRTSVSLGYAW